MKKRIIALLLIGAVLLCAGCGKKKTEELPPTEGGGTSVSTEASAAVSTEPATQEPSEPETTLPATTQPPEPSVPEQDATSFVYTSRNALGNLWARGIVAVTNDGKEPMLLDYGTFTYCDKDGNEILTVEDVMGYPQVLLPGERGYYYDESRVDTDASELTLRSDLPTKAATDAQTVRYEVTDGRVSDWQYGGLRFTGTMTNDSDQTASLVCVCVAVYGEDSELPLCVLTTLLTDPIGAGQSTEIEIGNTLLSDLTAADISDFTVTAYPLQVA